MTKAAVFGLGSMGYGMAASCVSAGVETYGYDPRTEAVARFVKEDGGRAAPFEEIGPTLDAVVIVVLNAAQVERVLDEVLPVLTPGAVLLACATVPPAFSRAMAQRTQARGVHYLDAPISGGAVKAASGALSIMASGSAAAFDAASPVLDAMSEQIFHLGGEVGAGSAMKAVNQLLAGVHIAAMAEAMTFAISQGIDPATFMDVIPNCAGTSWMLENRGPHIASADYTPRSQVDIWPKDLGIVLSIARDAGFPAPLTETALVRFKEAAAAGLGSEDDAAVAKVYAREAGLALPGFKP